MLVWPRAARSLLHQNRGPGATLPPTLIFVLGYLGALVVHLSAPLRLIEGAPILRALLNVAGVAAAAFGAALLVWAWRTLARERTGIMFQQAATHIVDRGPYRWSRNPMYVAFVAAYIGLALLANTVWPFVVLPLLIVCLDRFVIDREERYLQGTFGEDYRTYCTRVGRWYS